MISRLTIALLLVATALPLACGSSTTLTDSERDQIREEVRQLTRSLSSDLSSRGPMGWLRHFEDHPEFYMASDGLELFPSFAAADSNVRGFAPTIETIQLIWEDLRIDPHSRDLASIGSPFREVLLDTTGTTIAFGGYVTALAVRSGERWAIRNLHWSVKPPESEE